MKKARKTQAADSGQQDATTPPPPAYCAVMCAYLAGWAPVKAYGEGVQLRTSQQIVDDLADMCDITTNKVATIMWQLGFRSYVEMYGPHGWMMVPSPGTFHEIRVEYPVPGEG